MEPNNVASPTLRNHALLPWCVLCLSLWCAPTWAQASGAKKLIYYGWGSRDTQYVRDHWQEMEKMPFNGVGILVALDRQAWQQGKQVPENLLGWHVMGPRMFQVEDFHAAIEDLDVPKWHNFTDNFLVVSLSRTISPPGFNWFDDDGWRTIVNNFAVIATIAAKAGAKGLILDPEQYGYQLFSFEDQRKIAQGSFEEYVQKARQRGREVMTAIGSHLPDAVILSLSAYSVLQLQLAKGGSFKSVQHALLPAFYDGFLEAMPAGAYLVDGYEPAYGFKERKQFIETYRRIRDEAIKFSALPDRYREKVKAGFGLWLDNRRQPSYYRPEEFKRVLEDALDISDGYIWIYSQGPRFFPPENLEPSYIEAIAGALRAVRR